MFFVFMDYLIIPLRLSYSERQYKRKITEWHLDKNVKDEEMAAIFLEYFRRKGVSGKESIFLVRGKMLDNKKIWRYVGRKQKSDRYFAKRLKSKYNESILPPHIGCRTPSPTVPTELTSGLNQLSAILKNKKERLMADSIDLTSAIDYIDPKSAMVDWSRDNPWPSVSNHEDPKRPLENDTNAPKREKASVRSRNGCWYVD